ncbi:hypothetical protein D9M68_966120 [compost metagenome]
MRISAAGAFRTEARHDAAQAVGPVAGTELPAIGSDAKDKELVGQFFGGLS